MQFTGKNDGWLGGIDEAIALLKLCADDWSALDGARAVRGRSRTSAGTRCCTIEGPYDAFAHLETLCLGALGRRTRICTNARAARRGGAAEAGDVLRRARRSLRARSRATATARMVGGVTDRCRPTRRRRCSAARRSGTIPHALIAAYGGDTVKATKRVRRARRPDVDAHRARRLRERLGEDEPRRGARARGSAVGRAARHGGVHGRQVGAFRRWARSSRPA